MLFAKLSVLPSKSSFLRTQSGQHATATLVREVSWHEMLSESYRIGRPRQLYKGHTKRDYPA